MFQIHHATLYYACVEFLRENEREFRHRLIASKVQILHDAWFSEIGVRPMYGVAKCNRVNSP